MTKYETDMDNVKASRWKWEGLQYVELLETNVGRQGSANWSSMIWSWWAKSDPLPGRERVLVNGEDIRVGELLSSLNSPNQESQRENFPARADAHHAPEPDLQAKDNFNDAKCNNERARTRFRGFS